MTDREDGDKFARWIKVLTNLTAEMEQKFPERVGHYEPPLLALTRCASLEAARMYEREPQIVEAL